MLSVYSTYARGVAILLRRGLCWRSEDWCGDTEGRYAVVHAVLSGKCVTIACVYGPNADDPEFVLRVWHRIMLNGPSTIIWGGDFNLILDPTVDCSSAARQPHPAALAQLQVVMVDNSLYDVWRLCHPDTLEGTCIIKAWRAWSCINLWLLAGVAVAWVTRVEHLPHTLSDHAPVLLTLCVRTEMERVFAWRLPSCALCDSVLLLEVRGAIIAHFDDNEGSVSSPGVLWESFKVYM